MHSSLECPLGHLLVVFTIIDSSLPTEGMYLRDLSLTFTLSLSFLSFFPSYFPPFLPFFQWIGDFANPKFLSFIIVCHICTRRYNSKSYVTFLALILLQFTTSSVRVVLCIDSLIPVKYPA